VLFVHLHQPEREHAALRALAAWAIRFAPIVAPDPPDGLLIDITGCQRLHGGERRLINAIANNLEWLGFRVRIACASTFACAWAVARFGEFDRAVVAESDERIAMHPLPIESLRMDASIVEPLREVGVATVGELLRIPRLQLAARYGESLLLRIDQVFGEAIETVEPVRPVPNPYVERAFDGPVKQMEAIELASRDLLEKLIELLHQNESGLNRLDMFFERIDAPDIHDSIRLAHPGRDFRHLWSVIKPRIENLHLGFGIEHIMFTAAKTSPVAHVQHGVRTGDLLDENRASVERAVGELTDYFIARLGPDRVSCMRTRESHVPERAAEYVGADLRHGCACRNDIPGYGHQPTLIRPSRLFPWPLPIEVVSLSPEGPLLSVRIRGELLEAIDTVGPERIADEWWRAASRACPNLSRDYYKVQIVSGRWLWLFRESVSRRWFLHGEWM